MSPDDKQRALLPDQERSGPPISGDASLQAAAGAFEEHMKNEGFAFNTIKAFLSDLRLLGSYLGVGQSIGEIGTQNLNNFLHWLLNERGTPCSPKSYSRRITTLKVFFGWLHQTGVLTTNPAAAVIQQSVSSPLPNVPTSVQLERALALTHRMRLGEIGRKEDARPYMLLKLLWDTAVKKSEAMSIVPNHIDRSDPENPVLFVRYANPRMRYKERKLPLDPAWITVVDEYLAQYKPKDTLFTCTARNLEYIMADIAEVVGIDKGALSFENLRWASAIRDYRNQVESDDIRQKLGLSKITWRETKAKLEKLVQIEDEALAKG